MPRVCFNSWVPFIKLKNVTKLYDSIRLKYAGKHFIFFKKLVEIKQMNDSLLNSVFIFKLFLSITQWRF